MKKKAFRKKIAAGVMALALGVTSLNTAFAAPDGLADYNRSPAEVEATEGVNPYTNGVYTYSSSDPLFAATKFHIFAEDAASIQTHCNGNIATKFLYQQSNSGSNTIYETQLPEVSYIRKLDESSVINFGPNTQVVFGDETNVYNKDNAEIYIDTYGSRVDDTPEIKKIETSKQADGTFRVFTEAGSADDKRFVNFNEEFRKLSILSYNLAKEPSDVTIKENVIDMKGLTGTKYINVTPGDFMGNALIIDNTDFKSGQALVINVDLGTATNYTLPFTQVLFKDADGNSFGLGEDKEDLTGYGNVLWNFYGRDESGAITTYTGEIMTCTEFKGTILAPDAVIRTANSNQDGNFIGREVHLGGGETHRWDFGGTLKSYNYNTAFGSLNAKATEQGTTTGVAGVEIYVYLEGDENNEPVAKIITDANGNTTTVGSLPVGDDYVGIVKQVPYGYKLVKDNDVVTISSENGVYTLEYELTKDTTVPVTPTQGYVKVVVKDADTGAYLENVKVTITDTKGDITDNIFDTDEFGTTTTGKLDKGDVCTVTVTDVPAGYIKPTTPITVTVTEKNPDEVIIELSKHVAEEPKEGSIQIIVIEKDTNRAIEGAVVKITDDEAHIVKEVTVVTGKDGKTEIVSNLGIDDTYMTDLISVPEGFKFSSVKGITVSDTDTDAGTLNITNAKPDVVTYILEQEKGSLVSKVVDENGEPVPGVTIEVYDLNGNLVKTYTTNTNGFTEEYYNLPAGNQYTAKITDVPDGYVMPALDSEISKSECIQNGKCTQFDFVIQKIPTGNLEVTVQEKDTTTKVANAVVEVYNSNDELVKTVTTDSTGYFEIKDLPTGEYTIKTTQPAGYLAPDSTNAEKVTTVNLNATASVVVELEKIPTGNLEVTVQEKDTTTKVANAVVEVYNSNDELVKTVTTDSTGHFVVNDLPVGTYTVKTTEPAGYKELEDSEATKTAIVIPNGIATVVVELEKIPTGNLDVTVKEKGTTTKIENAIVEVYKVESSTETLVDTVTTDDTGHFVIENLPIGDYKIVTTSPTGYKAPDAANSPKAAEVVVNETEYVEVELTKETGLLDVIVKYPNGTTVSGVSVTVKGDDISETSFTTGVDGDGTTMDLENLTIGEMYSVEVKDTTIPKYYTLVTSTTDTNPREVTIPDKNKVTVVFEVKNTGILDITVRDEKTDEVIPGAIVQVVEKDNPDKVVADNLTTGPDGKVVVKDLDTGEYTIIVKDVPSGYNKPTENKDASVTAGSTTEETLKLNKPGNLHVIITDEKTGAVIPGATVEIKNDATGSVITRVTNESGEITVTGLQPGNYTVTTTAVPKDYNIPGPESAVVKSDETANVPLEVVKVPGDLVVTITDANTGLPIADATIVVRDSADNEVARVTTDSEGKFTVEDLYPDDYKIITESIPSTYPADAKPADTTATVVSGQTTQKDLLVPSTAVDNTVGKLIVTITDENTKLPIAGAEIELTYPDGTKETIITDSTGKFEKDKTAPGTYTITTVKVPTGYTAPGQQTATVVGGQTTQKDLVVAQGTTGTLVVVVTDVNGNPVSGVGITLTDSNGTQVGDKLTTGADGKTTEVTGLVLGEEYKATLDQSTLTNYYVLNDTVNVKAETVANATTLYEIPFEVKKTGALEVTIKDKNTGEPIKGATVTITNKDTNEVVADKVITDADGKVTVSGLPGGNYTVTTNSVPDGYTAPGPQDMEVTVGDTATEELFVEKGSLQVQITDKNTGAAIPEATVVIKKPDGTVVATVVTDENGMTPVVKDLAIGTTYTIETTKVPSGYTAPTPTTQEIKSATTEVVKLLVGRDSGVNSTLGSMSVIITDKNTGKPIPGATVEITNSAGEVIKTVVTDDTGAFTVTDLKPDTYTVKTTKVPEGYTAPDTQKAEVKANARTDVHLYVVKGASSSQTPNTDKVVQTGDESNVQAVSILAVLACLGIVIVSIMRKREENLI